jgi:hypothetical protein
VRPRAGNSTANWAVRNAAKLSRRRPLGCPQQAGPDGTIHLPLPSSRNFFPKQKSYFPSAWE